MLVSKDTKIREIIFKFDVIKKVSRKEPNLSVDTALYIADKLWEKELKYEKELVN